MAERRFSDAGRPRLSRHDALSVVVDLLVMAADEAGNRDSAGHLRDAAARVGDAISVERRRALV